MELEVEKIVYVFVDVANVWSVQKSMRKLLDYTKLRKQVEKIISQKCGVAICVQEVFYYEAYPQNSTRSYNTDGSHKFMTFLKKELGFKIRKKPIKQIRIEKNGNSFVQEKGNMDIELTIDAIHHQQEFDIAVLFTGDSDFFSLVKYLARRGKESYVFSSRNNISQELRTGTNGYFDIKMIPDLWGSDLKYRHKK